MPQPLQNHQFPHSRRRFRRSYLELLLVGLGSLVFAGFSTGLWVFRSTESTHLESKNSAWISEYIPEPTYCTEVEAKFRKRELSAEIVRKVSPTSAGRALQESGSSRRALTADQSTSHFSGRVTDWRIGSPSDSGATASSSIQFGEPWQPRPDELTFHLPGGEGNGFYEGGGEGLPGNGGFNEAGLDGNAGGLREPTTPGRMQDTLGQHSRGEIKGGQAHSFNDTGAATPRVYEIDEIPGRLIPPQPSSDSPMGIGRPSPSALSQQPAQSGPGASTNAPPQPSNRSFRPIAPPVIPSIAAGGSAAAGSGSAGGASSGGSPIVSGSAAPPTPVVNSSPRGPITPLPPASIPEAAIGSVGGGAGASRPASGGGSGAPVPSAPTYSPPAGASPPSAPGRAPAGFHPIPAPVPAAVPPQAAGGVAGVPIGVGVPAGGIGGGIGGSSLPSGGGASSPSFSPGSTGTNIGGTASNPSGPTPPGGGSSYTPPETPPSDLSPGTNFAPSGSSPGGSSLPPPAPLVPIVPAVGAGAAAGGGAGGVPAGLPAPLAPVDVTGEEPTDSEMDEEKDLPQQCIPWVVQEGQTIQSLAQSVGSTPSEILEINKTTSLFPGQVIRLPIRTVIPCCE